MMTQKSSYSRIIAVWMVLFAFFGGMVFPSYVQAKVDMTIATEGDPTDGLDYAGGGGGGYIDDGNQKNSSKNDISFELEHLPEYTPDFVLIVPQWDRNHLTFSFILILPNEFPWGKSK